MFLVLLATLLRLWHVGSTDIGQDESFSAMCALFPIGDIIYILTKGDNPPLWEILLHYWEVWFGVSLVAMRMLPLIFNVLTVVPIYLTGVRFGPDEFNSNARRYSGLFAALLFIFSDFALFLSHEIRVYSLIGFLSAWSLYFFVGWLRQPGRLLYKVGLTVANILLMYGHYMAIWVVVVQVLLWLAVPRCRKALGFDYLWHLLVLALAYVPMYPVLWGRFLESGLHGTWVPRADSIRDLLMLPYEYLNQDKWLFAWICLMAGGYIVRMMAGIRRRTYRFGLFDIVVCMWAVPLVVSFLLSFRVGFLLDRYFYFTLPPLYLSLAWLGLMLGRWMTEKSVLPGLLCQMVVLGLMVMNFHADSAYLQYDHYDTRDASKALRVYSECQGIKSVITPGWIVPKMVYNFDSHHEIFRTQCELIGRDVEYNGYSGFLAPHRIYGDDFKPFDFSGDSVVAVFYRQGHEPKHLVGNLREQGFDLTNTENLKSMRIDFYRKNDGL